MGNERKLDDIIKEAHETAVQHGWWDDPKPTFGDCIALCHSELSEALEDYRNHDDSKIPDELADVCIRIFSICGEYGIDLNNAILDKMEFNKVRSYRHGGKRL